MWWNDLWDHVTLIPDASKIIVFNRGTPQGEKGIIPIGGHWLPNSILGAKLAWKKAQKKERKKNTSEIINNTIPDWRPSVTIFVWSPWKDPSVRYHVIK